ncbi:MAG: hypothetical protein HYU68_06880 [Bacteroidetes bacterium]|nr:hypothetical protein [Bacteroidota bacterium]
MKMKIKMKKQIVTATLILTVTMFVASCGSKTSENNAENTTTEQIENVKYQCPMKCEGEKTYDKPGQCPKCNMDLEQIEKNHEHSEHNH